MIIPAILAIVFAIVVLVSIAMARTARANGDMARAKQLAVVRTVFLVLMLGALIWMWSGR